MDKIKEFLKLTLGPITANRVGLLGVVLVNVMTLVTIIFVILDVNGFLQNPYFSTIGYIFFPMLFFIGLILVGIGYFLHRRHVVAHDEEKERYPILDLNLPEHRLKWLFWTVITAANLVIIGLIIYGTTSFTGSVYFCGKVCHTPMEPEFTTYQESAHSRVHCVQCHIGSGASWYVKSKISGLRQVFAVMFDTYSKPIPHSIHDLRPAQGTCEQCHWPQKFHGDIVKTKVRYLEDEKNTAEKTKITLRIGGRSLKPGDGIRGIHWHVRKDFTIRYKWNDKLRNKIVWVEKTGPQGKKVYASEEYKKMSKEKQDELPTRVMDCVDCHNRPTHKFQYPEHAVDQRMNAGVIPVDIPFMKRESVKLLKNKYEKTDRETEIPKRLMAYYRENYPEIAKTREADLTRTGKILVQIHKRNVFPKMNLYWGAHPTNLQHENPDAPGCFRCHTDELHTAGGASISQDCELCHIRMDEL